MGKLTLKVEENPFPDEKDSLNGSGADTMANEWNKVTIIHWILDGIMIMLLVGYIVKKKYKAKRGIGVSKER